MLVTRSSTNLAYPHTAVHERQGTGDVGGLVGGQIRIAAATSAA
jgi:hypothetical protein